MKDSESINTYTIDINNNQYTFSCTDGEDYVQRLKARLKEAIDAASNSEPGQVLSKYGMKVALLLADQVVREEIDHENQRVEATVKIESLAGKIDEILGED